MSVFDGSPFDYFDQCDDCAALVEIPRTVVITSDWPEEDDRPVERFLCPACWDTKYVPA